MMDRQSGQITCDGCLQEVTEGGYVLRSSRPGWQRMVFAHNGCLERVENLFRSDSLDIKTPISEADFLRRKVTVGQA